MLSKQHKLFCKEYVKDFVGARAYIRAGYDESGAKQNAYGLLQRDDIKTYVTKLVEARGKRLDMTADDIFNELVNIAKDDIGNYLEFDEREVVRDDWEGNPKTESIVNIKIKDSTNISTKNIKSITRGKDGQFKIELYSRDAALEKLGRIHGIFEKDNSQKMPDSPNKEVVTAILEKLKW